MKKKLVFNASMPRAGSELLQVLLHQNPRIYGSATSPLLEYQFGARNNYELAEVRSQEPELMLRAFLATCRGMADAYYDAVTDRPVVCDKNRGWSHYFEWVEQWQGEQPKIICAVRDLRSILGSFERVFRANRHRPVGPDNPQTLENMTVGQRAAYWLNTQPVGLSLVRLADSFNRRLPIHYVRYEDLTTNPREELKKIYQFIGEENFDGHDFDNVTKEVFEDCSVFGPYGNHNVKSKVVPFKPGDWADVIPNEVAEQVRRDNAWYFQAFNY